MDQQIIKGNKLVKKKQEQRLLLQGPEKGQPKEKGGERRKVALYQCSFIGAAVSIAEWRGEGRQGGRGSYGTTL